MTKYIPNFITCLNLFCGCVSIVFTFSDRLDFAAYFILFAAIFDFLDGTFARLLKAYSEIGKQLDSLADMVSFGVAPASIMYKLLLSTATFQLGWIVAFSAYIIAIFSALRLAKFNIDARQSESFIGLPTPANAIFICSLTLSNTLALTGNIFLLSAVTLVFSYLLVAELPLFSFKFKSFDWKNNKIRYIFVVISMFLLLFLNWNGLAIAILIYITTSLIIFIYQRKAV